MISSVRLKAPAKINLALDILGKRSNGYHSMKMILQTVSLHNQITVKLEASPQITITCSNPEVPCDERNFCHKAARLFFETTGVPQQGLSIDICKAIPMEAGLAGGSTDAAAVLVALDQLFEQNLSCQQLCDIGVHAGADVPFCIAGGTMLTEGIGELLTPLPAMPDCYILIAKPPESMKTAVCFARFDNIAVTRRPDIDRMSAALAAHDLPEICDGLCNVFEEAVSFACIGQIKQTMLEYGALGACMTGSGTAVFGVFESKRMARRCLHRLLDSCNAVFLTTPTAGGAACF